MKQLLSLILALCLVHLALTASTPQEEVTSNYDRSGSNHYAYPIPVDMAVPTLTDAPAGYEPFYMSHYGFCPIGNSKSRPARSGHGIRATD